MQRALVILLFVIGLITAAYGQGAAPQLGVQDGGTGAKTAAAARANLGSAASGANSDIFTLLSLTSISFDALTQAAPSGVIIGVAGAITANSSSFTDAGTTFTNANVGQTIVVAGADSKSGLKSVAVSAVGVGYTPRQIITAAGGTNTTPSLIKIDTTTLVGTTATLGGTLTGYTNGQTVTLYEAYPKQLQYYAPGTEPQTLTPPQIRVIVSGGIVTGYTILNGGAFIINPVKLIDVAGGNLTLTGTLPLMGAASAHVLDPGVYSATAGSLTQATVNTGSGTGATFTPTWFPYPLTTTIRAVVSANTVTLAATALNTISGGSWYAGPDATNALQACINATISAPLTECAPPSRRGYLISSTLTLSQSFQRLSAAPGGAGFHVVSSVVSLSSNIALYWAGAPDGTMVSAAQPSSGGAAIGLSLSGDGVRGWTFNCNAGSNGYAGIGLYVAGIVDGYFEDMGFNECQIAGMYVSSVPTSTDVSDTLHTMFRSISTVNNLTSGYGVEFAGLPTGAGDVTYGLIENFIMAFCNAPALYVGNVDNVVFDDMHSVESTGCTNPVGSEFGGNGGRDARSILFLHPSLAGFPMIDGTAATGAPHAAFSIQFVGNDTDNHGPRMPLLDNGTQASVIDTSGAQYGAQNIQGSFGENALDGVLGYNYLANGTTSIFVNQAQLPLQHWWDGSFDWYWTLTGSNTLTLTNTEPGHGAGITIGAASIDFPPGTVTAPGITLGDTTTGLFSSVAGCSNFGSASAVVAYFCGTSGVSSIFALNAIPLNGTDFAIFKNDTNATHSVTIEATSTGPAVATALYLGNSGNSSEFGITVNGANNTTGNGVNSTTLIAANGMWLTGSTTAGTGLKVDATGTTTVLGTLSIAAGSASVPAINFGTANTGIYGSSTYVETTVGNTNVLYAGLNSTVPFVGIGSVGAINNDVFASDYNANGAWGATLKNTSTGTSAQTVFDFGNGTSSNEAYILLNGINVTAQNGANAMDIVGKAGVWISGSATAGTGLKVDANGTTTVLNGLVGGGPSPTGSTGSCVASGFTGGSLVGTFSAAVCVAGTFILSGMPTTPNGYSCSAYDRITPSDTVVQTGSTATSATFKATTVASDVVQFNCQGY